MSQFDISLVLPAYNEAKTITGTINEAVDYFRRRGKRYEIIVAADGDDGTREIVTKMSETDPALRAIGSPARLGKGRGVREAVMLASGDIIGYADADNKVPIDEYGKIEPWFERGYQVVIGSRALKESAIERKQPLYRQLGSKGFAVVMQTIVGLRHISDTQCGFKFFRRDVAEHIFPAQSVDGYMFDVEVLYLAQSLGYRLKEIPIRWRDDGDSRLNLVSGNVRNMRDLFRIRRASRQAVGRLKLAKSAAQHE